MAHFFVESLRLFREKKSSRMGAALSYYAIFIIAPLSLLIMSLVVALYGNTVAESSFLAQLNSSIGPGAGDFVESLMESFTGRSLNITGLIVVIATIAFAVVNFFSVLKGSLDTIWESPDEKEVGLPRLAKKIVIFSVIPVAALLFLVLVSFSLFISDYYSFQGVLAENLILLVFSALFFMFLYRVVPTKKLPLRAILFGGIITALLFVFGRFAIILYISNFAQPTIFGAANSLVAVLVWIYYSAQVFFFGAAATYVFSKRT